VVETTETVPRDGVFPVDARDWGALEDSTFCWRRGMMQMQMQSLGSTSTATI
jgi:hypothetical protein